MVSEAGVELVSIENEINDNVADEFQDGTDAASDTDNTDAQQAESETVTSGTPDADFQMVKAMVQVPFQRGQHRLRQLQTVNCHNMI